MTRVLLLLLLAASVLLATNLPAKGNDRIQWRTWEAAAFAEAREKNKPMLINVGYEGCTACRFMNTNTFTNADVIAFMNAHYIPVQVDSEARPEIGERYSDWAWPATAFLKPDGSQIFAIRGSRRAGPFLALLQRVIERHTAGELRSDDLAPYAAPTGLTEGPLTELRLQVRRQLDGSFDTERGGWGEAKVLEYAEPTLQLFWRAHLYDDDEIGARAIKTANGFLQHVDPIWGGVFYASFGEWDNVVHEKRLESQAAALQLFADAYQVTGDERFKAGIANVARYLADWMSSPQHTFYASEKDLIPGLPDSMSADDFFALDDKGRRKYGRPHVDRAVYTDVNARTALGFMRAFEATGIEAYRTTAARVAQSLIETRQTDAGWILQFAAQEGLARDLRVHAVEETAAPYLRAQAQFGAALLALYQGTSERRWLDAAVRLAAGLRTALEDEALGGFYGGPATAVDAIVGRRKPLEDNAVAARFLYWLGVLTKDGDLKAAAERTLRATAAPGVVEREGRITGNLAISLELLIAGYVEFSVVGDHDDPAAHALLEAGRAVYEPRKLVHFEKPGRYPARDKPAMYICNEDQCSLPISDPGSVPLQAAQFTPANMAKVADGSSAR